MEGHNYGTKTTAELKEILRSRKLKVLGKKGDLVRNDFITATSVPYLTACPTRGFLLNTDHHYYHQGQGQLMCTGRQ